jgi:1,4-dihydroxy-6-naphthoate synthase
MADDRPVLRIGQSPDPDDAFMWWPLAGAQAQPAADFDTGRFRYEAVPADIETLNCRAEQGELEITALSCAQYPHVARHYMVTNSGASMGQQCGPKIVAGRAMSPEELHEPGTTLAVPGEHTTALAVASMLLGPGTFRYAAVPFDEIIEAVSQERYAAGVVIHEGQLTFEQAGAHLRAGRTARGRRPGHVVDGPQRPAAAPGRQRHPAGPRRPVRAGDAAAGDRRPQAMPRILPGPPR